MLHHRQLKFMCALILVMGVMFVQTMTEPALAQTNLLKDPGFENSAFNVVAPATPGGDPLCAVPADWGGWLVQGSGNPSWQNRQPTCTGNSDKANSFVRSGNRSQEISRGSATFTAAIYQTVSGVAVGTNLIGQAYYVMEVGSGSNAQVRVGIDPNGGTNPLDSDVVWSNWGNVRRNTDGFGPLTVNATATGTSVTLFIYTTQTLPTDPNKVFIDDASLVAGGGGGAVASGTPLFTSTPTVPPVPVANFVVPQGTVRDGFVVHTVVEGDTLAAIATAYRVPIETLRELNPEIGRGSFLFIGQFIRIREATAQTATPTTVANSQPIATATPSGNAGISATNTPVSNAVIPATNTPVGNTVATNTPAPTLTTVPRTQGNSGAFITATPRGGTSSNPTATTPPTATEEVVITEEPTQITEEVTQAVVVTEEATEVIIQPTATPAPTNTAPAPVVEPTVVAMNPETTMTGVCVTFFDDVNRNRFADADEVPVVGGVITLRLDNTDVSSFLTEGNPEPFCFDNLVAGNYVVTVSPPTGYGMTTPSQLQLRVDTGARLNVPFGAAAGVVEPTVVAQTQPEQPAVIEQPVQSEATADNNDGLLANLGIIILALAGFTLISGIIGTILISRRG